jgi:cob(I)alamin adenosyltransferase
MSSGSPKIYTRTGDKGKTSLIGGSRVSKSDLRLEAYGTLDELNSYVGWLRAELNQELADRATEVERGLITSILTHIQIELFNLGSQLACEDEKLRASLPTVKSSSTLELEAEMDRYSKTLIPLKNFILPGGSRLSSMAHVARTICRRAERAMVVGLGENEANSADTIGLIYINRLSDYFFVLARHINDLLKIEEPLWRPEAP